MPAASGPLRHWETAYDRPHLAVPALIAFLAALILWTPGRPLKRERVVPPAPARVLPTTILSPTAGVVLPAGHTGFVEGLAQPGSIIRLYWYDRPLGEPTQVGADGRWRFSVANFPPGQHALRASGWLSGRYEWSQEVVFTVAAPGPAAKNTGAAKPTRPNPTPRNSNRP